MYIQTNETDRGSGLRKKGKIEEEGWGNHLAQPGNSNKESGELYTPSLPKGN